MKALRALLTLVTLGLLIAFSGCGPKGGGTETVQDKQLGLLSKTWKVSSVSDPNGDATTTWQNFTITISGTKGATSFNYTCAGRPAQGPWPASGTWSFVTTNNTTISTEITRNEDSLPITYGVTATTLTLSFIYPSGGTIYTRNQNLGGSWQFNMTAQ